MKNLGFALLVTVASACGTGGATVSSDLDGTTFDFKTVYGWIDAKRYETEGAKAVLKDQEHKSLVLRFSGASFDPQQDQAFVSVDDLLGWMRDENINGSMFLSVRNGDKAVKGTTAVYPAPDEAKEDSVYIQSARMNYAKTEVKSGDELRAEIPSIGSKKTITLTFDEVGTKAGETIAGTVEIKFEKDEHDPDGVKTGTIKVEFSALLINQAIGQTNGQSLDLD